MKRRPIPISWARPTPPLRGRARRSLSFSPRVRPSPPHRRRARRRLALSPRARQSYPKGIGRGGTKLLSFEQGTLRRPYPSRSFYRSVVIGSTFWGTPVLGPRQVPLRASTKASSNWPHSRSALCLDAAPVHIL